MESAVAVTYELDDMPLAADELLHQIHEKITIQKESIAILYVQPNLEVEELADILYQQLGFTVIGGTTASASLISGEGYHELAILLQVITADDCQFSTAISEQLTDDPQQQITNTYVEAYEALKDTHAGSEPKMVFVIASVSPGHKTDCLVSSLSAVSEGLPLFGFLSGDDFKFCEQSAFLNGTNGIDRVVVLLIAGNVEPLFEVMTLKGSESLSRRKITKAHDNIISEIDYQPAIEYLKGFSFIGDDTTELWSYQFFVELENEPDTGNVAVCRALKSFDRETGEITCFASIPENSYISLQYCNDCDVKDSSDLAISELLKKLEQKAKGDYRYSTVLIVSGILRSLFLTNQKNAEGILVSEKIPKSLTVSGVYGMGEIAPTAQGRDRAINCYHNAAMVICVL